MKKKWTEEAVEKEIEELQAQDWSDAKVSYKRGRPRKKDSIKTNLDLTPEILAKLDEIADLMNVSRQAVVKSFILSGLNDYYRGLKSKDRA